MASIAEVNLSTILNVKPCPYKCNITMYCTFFVYIVYINFKFLLFSMFFKMDSASSLHSIQLAVLPCTIFKMDSECAQENISPCLLCP